MSLGTSNRDGGKTSESGHLRALGKVVYGDVIAGLAVSQRGAGANMSVDISVGDAFLRRSDGSYAHPVFNDAVYNLAVTTADGSNPRRDLVVLYLDYGVTPSSAVSNNTNNVVKIKTVNGLAAGSPVDPNAAAIQASVGAGNPYTVLGRVRIPAGQTSISNTLIDDLRTFANAKEAPGTVKDFAGSTAPAGWLLCYGQNVSRSTYAELFATIGTTYGAGDGSTTFALPDARGRAIAGKDDMGGSSANRLTNLSGGVDGDILGANGGAESHILTTAQIPAHNHRILIGWAAGGTTSDTIGYANTYTGARGYQTNTGGSGTPAIENTGGGGAHNNVQPTLILNKIIAY